MGYLLEKRPDMDGMQIWSRFPVVHRSNMPGVMLDDRDERLRVHTERKRSAERTRLISFSPDRGRNGGRIGDSLNSSARPLSLRPRQPHY